MFIITVGVVAKLVILGDTTQLKDQRIAVNMTKAERIFVLNEMRGMLAGVQAVLQASLDKDMQAVILAAKPLGMSVASHAPPGLPSKLPLEFKTLGFGTHQDFDCLAQDAQDLGDPQHTLNQLVSVMQKCVACHATYQIHVVE